ncbi:MAG: C1 family peptidase [Chloroflexota bacterium]|nr:C1 family peptidase [Chloroflexota bacterium]
MNRAVLAGRPRVIGGWRKSALPPRRLLDEPPTSAIRSHSDLRGRMPPVMDQGSTGDCTAHAALEVREHLILRAAIATDDASKLAALAAHGARFSRLYQYARTRQREGTPLADDSGASVADAFAVLEDAGACPAATWSDDDAETRFALDPGGAADIEAHRHRVVLGFALPSLRALRASLSEGFPVGFGFAVPANMMSEACAATGIVKPPAEGEEMQGGHAVTACGHDDAMVIDGVKGAILAMNHWSVSWGQAGFFWLPYGFFDGGLAEDAHTARRSEDI